MGLKWDKLCGVTTDGAPAMTGERKGMASMVCAKVKESRDLKKAYGWVSREELWHCMKKSGVAEKYVKAVQDMYEHCKTGVRCAVGVIEEFQVEL
ncbi:unnamed protein product [Tetraodon nigroviridis]|uniref:(spotted green pufferfish) hypothetical protein n=1 Tax=Tetraodon nigroviridis TaxID=99883 RepID=Q4T1G8_TETNG|nr:unnamed protein product [Tetraodon nigroviridis]